MDQSNRDGSNISNAVTGVCPAAAADSDPQECSPPPPYMKLIADCWEHILDYLPFDDMYSLGETCKRLHRMVTYYLRENFPNMQFMLVGKKIQLEIYSFSFPVEYGRFVSILCISYDFECDYSLDADTFHSLRTLIFRDVNINNDHIRCLRDVLKNVEKLDFENCSFKDETFEQIANLCRSKLKSLNIDDMHVTGMLFSQHYPVLENYKCIQSRYCSRQPMPELNKFLEKHTQLKRFESNYQFLWDNRNTLNASNVKLDQLTVQFSEFDDQISSDEFVGFLKKLCERRFFKAVHLFFVDNNVEWEFEDLAQQMSPLASALSGLNLWYSIRNSITDLTVLINLKEIRVFEIQCSDEEMEILAKNLEKLEKLSFDVRHVRQIEPFVRHSKALKTMEVHEYLNDTPINLIQLNQDRQQLENAQPMVIFAEEHIYLWAKWNPKHLNLRLNLVKISRLDPTSSFFST